MNQKLKNDFKKIFGTELLNFNSRLSLITGKFDFHIIEFDEFIQKKFNYNVENDGSLKDFIKKRFGIKADNLIKKLIRYRGKV